MGRDLEEGPGRRSWERLWELRAATINLSPQVYFNILIAIVAILPLNVSSAIKYEKGRFNSHTLIASESLGELLVENTDVDFPPQTFPLNDTLWGPGAAHYAYET